MVLNKYQYIVDASNEVDRLLNRPIKRRSGNQDFLEAARILCETLTTIVNDQEFFNDITSTSFLNFPNKSTNELRSYFKYFLDREKELLVRKADMDYKLAQKINKKGGRLLTSLNSMEDINQWRLDKSTLKQTIEQLRSHVCDLQNLENSRSLKKTLENSMLALAGLSVTAVNSIVGPPTPLLGVVAVNVSVGFGVGLFLDKSNQIRRAFS